MKDWREDRDMLRELVRIYAKTNGFETPQTMTIRGESIPIADSFFEMCRQELGRIVATRGSRLGFHHDRRDFRRRRPK